MVQASSLLCTSFSIGFSLSCRRQTGRFVVSLCRFLPGDAACPARLIPFPVNRFKNWPFLSAVCGKCSRMAAKLRPVVRQTTPPGHAGALPSCGAKKRRNFFTGLREKESAGQDRRHPQAGSGIKRPRTGPPDACMIRKSRWRNWCRGGRRAEP